jgi:hypothetical protein
MSAARSVVILSWPAPKIVNAGSTPILNVTLLGADRYTTSYGTYIDWHCEPTVIRGSLASVAVLKSGDEHRFTDGYWTLRDQAGNVFGDDWERRLSPADRAVAARVEWTDSNGQHWQRSGNDEPCPLKQRSTAELFPAGGG